MSLRQEVVLVCGHLDVATHDKGGRIITCSTCDVQSVVQAKSRVVITYSVAPVTYQQRLDLGA